MLARHQLHPVDDLNLAPYDPALAWALLHAASDGALWDGVDGHYCGVRLLRLAVEAKRVALLDAELLLATSIEADLPSVVAWMHGRTATQRAAALGLEVVEGDGIDLKHRLRNTAAAPAGQELSQATLQEPDRISPTERARLMEYAAITAAPKARLLFKVMEELEACGSGPLPNRLFLGFPGRDPSQ